MQRNLILIIVLFAAVIIAAIYLYPKNKTDITSEVAPTSTAPAASATFIARVTYKCANSRKIDATYFQNKVALILSDGRSLEVPQTMSASGARYANADESFVFWNKGDTAFITEGNATTYQSCNQVK